MTDNHDWTEVDPVSSLVEELAKAWDKAQKKKKFLDVTMPGFNSIFGDPSRDFLVLEDQAGQTIIVPHGGQPATAFTYVARASLASLGVM